MIKRTVYVDVPKRIGDVSGEPNGFVDRTNSTITFFDSAPDRTFSIAPTGGFFEFYSVGKKFRKTASESVQITDTHGLWFIYYETDGVLTASQISWDFGEGKVFVALGYWDATNSSWIGQGEERHGLTMDWATHKHFHENFGALWESGFTPSVTVDGSGALDAHAEIQSISAGEMHDEDIELVSVEQTSYEIWYKIGASGDWFKTVVSAAVVAITTTRPDFNEFIGGAWQRTEVSNNNFMLMHQFATNDINKPNILIMGENEYITKSAAQDAAPLELSTITTAGLPTAEFREIATFIVQCRDAYTNSYNARLVSTSDGSDFIDFRESERTGIGASTNHHGNLTGLTEDDHPQYFILNGVRNGTLGINATSTIAFTVEQNGVHDNTFIIDTTNGRVGIGMVPTDLFNINAAGNAVFTGYEGIDLNHVNGIDYKPGSDIDTDIITVGVTGFPRIYWDESENEFVSTHDINAPNITPSTPTPDYYVSVTTTANSTASNTTRDVFDEDNYASYTSTANVTASGITYTQSDGRFTITNTGIYTITMSWNLSISSADEMNLIIKKNGVSVYTHDTLIHSSVDPAISSITLVLSLSADDYINFEAGTVDGVDTTTFWGGCTASIRGK